MMTIKNNKYFKLFFYSSSFFLLVFIILLLKFYQISHSIDNDTINPNSMFYGLPSVDLLKDINLNNYQKLFHQITKLFTNSMILIQIERLLI